MKNIFFKDLLWEKNQDSMFLNESYSRGKIVEYSLVFIDFVPSIKGFLLSKNGDNMNKLLPSDYQFKEGIFIRKIRFNLWENKIYVINLIR